MIPGQPPPSVAASRHDSITKPSSIPGALFATCPSASASLSPSLSRHNDAEAHLRVLRHLIP
ncbi:hypothetical protein [Almyronema epifaneia]|uniref:Uncharacterized protein n=1 Tax=Almyronema epifaneia S1 TaxID=2991925 RepID=A0ABW6IM74_9CYAN